ncbi:MAG TPA: hydrogenase maturation nickel metallochaperone HypA [Thermaerobacter sp.]
MHEVSIAQSLLELALQVSREQGMGRVKAIHVRLGVLSGVVPDALEFAFGAVSEGTPLAGAALVIEEVPVKVFCAPCGEEHMLRQPFPMRCPACGRPVVKIVGGREIELRALEGTG